MNNQGLRIPPDQAEMLLEGRKPKELYQISYLSKVHPDDGDLSKVMLAQVVCHLFAQDVNEAYALFSNNVPEDFPVLYVGEIRPIAGVSEDSMLDIKRGPRAVN